MAFKIKKENKTFVRVFITYGIHIWLLIFICNVAIFYSIRFFIKASTTRTTSAKPAVEVVEGSPVPTKIPTPVPTAVGPVISLSFSLPGIGTDGGNLKPSHEQRDVSIYLYNADSNTSDKNVKPLYTIKTQAVYDIDPDSSTYTLFVNKYIDLGGIAKGSYQIAIQTPQSLRQLIKSPNPDTVGGQLFELPKRNFFIISPQAMITGDIYPLPKGDNIMDINDYNMLVSCYNSPLNSPKCPDAASADLDDNGVVDGVDYNIMLLNFRTLLFLGQPIPTIPLPTPTIQFNPFISSPILKITNPLLPGPTAVKASPTPVTRSSNNGSGGTIMLILFIFIFGIIAFVIYKFHLFHVLFPKKSEEPGAAVDTPQAVELPPADQPESKTTPADMIEKSGYLKKVRIDEQAKGVWVTLADDAGITKGFYPKADITDGFVKIKGTMKNDEENKPYVFITELTVEG